MKERNITHKKPFFSVFIGLYNSEKIIHRFFDSVNNQTYRDFELIIIDDCSQDNTVRIVQDFLATLTDIDVTFIQHKQNKGIAFSRKESLNYMKGIVFVKWDHDDIQDYNQLQIFKETYLKYQNKNVASVWCLCKDNNNKIVGNKFPKEEMIGNYLEMYSKYILSSVKNPKERHNCINIEVHKEIYKYINDHKIIPENEYATATDLWATMVLLGYKTIYINKALRQYFIESDRQRMSHHTRKYNSKRIFIDRVTWINHYMNNLPTYDIYWKYRLFGSLVQYGILSDKSLKQILAKINSSIHRFIISLIYFPLKIMIKKT